MNHLSFGPGGRDSSEAVAKLFSVTISLHTIKDTPSKAVTTTVCTSHCVGDPDSNMKPKDSSANMAMQLDAAVERQWGTLETLAYSAVRPVSNTVVTRDNESIR